MQYRLRCDVFVWLWPLLLGILLYVGPQSPSSLCLSALRCTAQQSWRVLQNIGACIVVKIAPAKLYGHNKHCAVVLRKEVYHFGRHFLKHILQLDVKLAELDRSQQGGFVLCHVAVFTDNAP